MPLARSLAAALGALGVVVAAGCGGQTGAPPLSRDELLDPESCKACHPAQYSQWSGSMHAYAAEDPVFRAMNQRGQRETKGALGSFCVNCHAPMAVRSGATTDGLNLAEVPRKLRGVTCFFCHSVESITADHNNPLQLAADGVLRAGIGDPRATLAHPSAYSALHDRQGSASSALCGSCHDIVTPAGVALERTYREWRDSVYSHDDPRRPTQLQTCGRCHMTGSTGPAAAVEGAPARTIHDHSMPGVDLALTDFPNRGQQQLLVGKQLLGSIAARLCVSYDLADTAVSLTLDNVSVGHNFPSGSSQDRRAWVELVGYQGGQVVYSSGVVKDGQSITELAADPALWLLRDTITDADGKPVHMFWEAAKYAENLLTPAVTSDPSDPAYYSHAVTRPYTIAGVHVDRVTARLRLIPIGLDVLADLVASGDLDPQVASQVAVVDLGATVLEWTLPGGFGCLPQ